MIFVHSFIRNKRRITRFFVLCLLAGSSPIFAPSQDSTSGPRRQIFDKFLNFNQLIRNASVRPVWSAADDSFRFTENGVHYRIDPRKNTRDIDNSAPPVRPPVDPNNIPSPDGKHFLEPKNDNLFLGGAVGDKPEALTNDGTPDHSWAAASSPWSPDGTKIIVQRSDSRKVHQIPLVDFGQALRNSRAL